MNSPKLLPILREHKLTLGVGGGFLEQQPSDI
jgi:hypothetical protein